MSATKKKRAPNKRKGRITIDEYNTLQAVFYENQNINAAAKAAGVTYPTAKRYIEGPGDMRRGMTPIKDRWIRLQAEAQDRTDLTRIKLEEKARRLMGGTVEVLLAELSLIQRDVKERLAKAQDGQGPEPGVAVKDLQKTLDGIVRLFDRLEGRPDSRVEVAGLDGLYGMTDAEAMEAVVTGVLPAALRDAPIGGTD